MRAWTFGLAALCLPLMLGVSGPGQAQLGGGGSTFKLTVCNGYGKPIMLALVHRAAPNDQRFVVKGWFAIEQGCAEGELPRGNFGTFAFSATGDRVEQVWGGDIPICVNLSKNFERIVTDNYRCRKEAQELVVPFQGWKTTEAEAKIEFK